MSRLAIVAAFKAAALVIGTLPHFHVVPKTFSASLQVSSVTMHGGADALSDRAVRETHGASAAPATAWRRVRPGEKARSSRSTHTN